MNFITSTPTVSARVGSNGRQRQGSAHTRLYAIRETLLDLSQGGCEML
ncbi:MAG: hypothetical protein ACFNVV_03235 [Bacteroidota bacterium]